MFTVIMTFLLSIISIIGLYYIKLKNNATFKKILKVLAIIYFILIFITIFLPDGLIMSVDQEQVDRLVGVNKLFLILRIFKAIIPVSFIIGIIYDNKYFKNIIVYICLPIAFLSILSYAEYLKYYTMETGRGLGNVYWLSETFKNLLYLNSFRSVIFCIEWTLVIAISIGIILDDFISLTKIKEILNGLLILVLMLIQFMPIYIPQLLFEGFTDLKLIGFNFVHIIWIMYIILKVIVLYFIFENASKDTKYVVCMILAIALLMQYNSMFALTINIKRLPFQLCNLASYLILICLIKKSNTLFNFIFLINLVGACMALFVPDVNGNGLMEVWNMHFIYEHTNVIIIPILALLFKLFGPITIKSLKDGIIGFSIYFVFCIIIGIIFNILATIKRNDYFEVNYLFMFDKDKVIDLLPFLEPLTKTTFTLSNTIFYPLIMSLVYFGYLGFVLVFYMPFGIKNLKAKK